jgi:hypothetical protein
LGVARRDATLSGVEPDCTGAPTRVVVGYEPGIPPIEVGNGTRVVRVLERAFPKPCYELVANSYQREDIGPSVVKGQVDVGVVGIAAAESYAEQGVSSLRAQETEGVDTLLLHPATYSVVATKPLTPSLGQHSSSPWLIVPAGAALGVLALLICLFLLNFRLPRLDHYFERATTRVDPMLTGFRRTLEWVYGSTSGRVFALVWAGLGAMIALQGLSTRALTDATEPDTAEYHRGAELAAYPGRDVYEFRNQRWKKCPRPFQCLRNYEAGKNQALAGDRDVLCHYAHETHAAELDFRSDVGIPMVYALLLPSQTGEAAEAATRPKQRLFAALRDEAYAGSPWRACEGALAAVDMSLSGARAPQTAAPMP